MQKVGIIGSGLNGLALAYGLLNAGVDITIFEEGTFGGNYMNDSRTSFISQKSLDFFPDIAEKIMQNSGVIQHIYSFKNESKFVSELGGENMGYVVDNSLLKKELIAFIKQSRVKIVENTKVESLENTADSCAINSVNFDLVVCASGSNSSIHKLLGLKQQQIPYSQTAFVFDITHEFPHKNIAIEAFDSTCIIALLPKLNERTSSVILSIRDDIAEKITDQNSLEFLQAKCLRARHIGKIESIPIEIRRYPLSMKYLKTQAINSLFLIGDSFHSIHPVLGQGFNMSLKDIQKLCVHVKKMQKLGIPINHNLKSTAIKNVANHVKIGLASHIFGGKFISQNKIVQALTTSSIAISQAIPTKLKTKFLQKML